MSDKQLKSYKSALDSISRLYKENFAYSNGKNPTIIDKAPTKDPDNRIPIPLAKTAVTDMAGYAGRAGDKTVKVMDDGVSEDQLKEYKELLLKINEHNNAGLETSELYEEGCMQGVAYELFWVSEYLDIRTVTPEFKIVSGLEVFPVFTRDLKPTLEKAVRFWNADEDEYADVYFPLFMEHWIKPKNATEWVLDTTRGNEGLTEYPYKTVPLAIYPINRFRQALFESEKDIIDAHDDIISKSANEIDRFNAVKALLPGKVTKEFVDKLKASNVIDDLAQYDKWPEYLEKNLSGVNTFYNELANRLERLFHKSIKIADMTAESFAGGAQSGVAIAYKLIGMEFIASQIDTYFDQGLNKRIELINDVLETSYTYVNDIKVKVVSKRNLPIDEAAKVDTAIKLKGLISDEAYYRIFPKSIIPNVEEELDRQEEAPDKTLLDLFVLAMQAGKPVPAQFVADALRIDRAEWDRLSTAEQEARIKALSQQDKEIEDNLEDEESEESSEG